MRILQATSIILAVHANPDGMELVSDWYMREPDDAKNARTGTIAAALPEVRRSRQQPRLLHVEPAGVENMNRVLYREWFPQIVYNHHQTGPAGTVMFAPPFRDPFNYNFDPADPARHRHGRRGDAHALRRRRQAGRHDAVGRELLDLVERRPAHDGVLPQHDRPADRDDRQPDADRDPASCPTDAAAARRPAVPDRAADVALPPVDRLLGHRQLRGARLRRSATARRPALQHLPDGAEQHRARQHATPGRCTRGGSPR